MVLLKPLTLENLSYFNPWLNDKEVIMYSLSLFQKLNTKSEIENWYKTLLENKNNDLQYGIHLKENNLFVGYCGICNISKNKGEGEYFIFIGDKSHWGKGISTYVTKEIARVGFDELGLKRIMLTVSEPNIGGVKSYEKAGFKQIDMIENASLRDGKFHNKIVMEVRNSGLI